MIHLSKFIFFILAIATVKLSAAQQPQEQIQDYIDQYCSLAIQEQQRTGIPAAIKLAQAIHESGAGKGDLAKRANNHFGVKCKSNWTGLVVLHDDDAKGECFRAYDEVATSFKDHSDFLKTGSRYSSLFTLELIDYKGWANGLKKAGYATNPQYPTLIIKLIETYNLNAYTLFAMTANEGTSTNTQTGASIFQ